MPPTVFTDSKVAYTRRLPLANVVVRQLCTVVPSISAASRSSTCTVIVFVFVASGLFLSWA